MSNLKSKYKRQPNQEPPKKKGNADIISKMGQYYAVNTSLQEDVFTERKVKKATFELGVELHKRLRIFAVENDTTMVDVVEKALNEYLDRMNK